MGKDLDKLTQKYERGAAKFNELLDDIKWRKGDLKEEGEILKAMKAEGSEATKDDIESQGIVVRTQEKILENQLREAEEFNKHLKTLKTEIEELTGRPKPKKKRGKRAEAVHKEEE